MIKTVTEFIIEIIQSKGFTVGFMLSIILALGYDNWLMRQRDYTRIDHLEEQVRTANQAIIHYYQASEENTLQEVKAIQKQNEKILLILEANF